MPDDFLQFSVAATVIVIAATALARQADRIAQITRLGRLLIGSVLLAGVTSLPELTIDLNAIWLDLPDLAVGGLVGSSLFNLLILAIADSFHQTPGLIFSRVAVAHTLSATLSVAMTAIVGIGIVTSAKLGSWTFLGVGPFTLVLLMAYLLGVRLVYFDQQVAKTEVQPEPVQAPGQSLSSAIVGFAIAGAVVFAASPYLAESAGNIAARTGLGDTFVGTTLVALSTSLPELVATIAAIRLGSVDLAIGNVFGSNTFNMLLLVPLDVAYPGALLADVSQTHVLTCFAVILVTSIVVLGQLYRVEERILLLEPDAALVVVLTLSSLVLIYFVR